jgi:formylglycine-generating enzyme required for sulfatase activity
MGAEDNEAVVQRSTEALALADQALRIGDQAGAEEALASIAQEMLKSVPLAGPVLSEAFKRAFAKSAYMLMQQEVAAQASAQEKDEHLERLLSRIWDLLEEMLIQNVNVQYKTHAEVLEAIEALHQEVSGLRAAYHSPQQGTVTNNVTGVVANAGVAHIYAAPNPIPGQAPPRAARHTERSLTWLHLDSLHIQSSPIAHWQTIQTALWAELADPPSGGMKPDVVVVTGDLAWSGQASEYDHVQRFFQELRAKTNNAPILFVPGNHDVAHLSTDDSRLDWLEQYQEDKPRISARREELWNKPDSPSAQAVRGMFRSFEEFVGLCCQKGWTPRPEAEGVMPGDGRWSLEVGGFRLGVVGLNSAWRLFGPEGPAPLVAPQQRNSLWEGCDEANFAARHHLTMLVQHHPPHLLGNQTEWGGAVRGQAQLALCGHQQGDAPHGGYNQSVDRVVLQASSALGLKTWSNSASRELGFMWGRARAHGGKLEVRIWERVFEARKSGGWGFTHPSSRVSYREHEGKSVGSFDVNASLDEEPDPASPATSAPSLASDPALSKRLLPWERRYLEARRSAWCDGRPDLLQHLAQGKVLNRARLYVPLQGSLSLSRSQQAKAQEQAKAWELANARQKKARREGSPNLIERQLARLREDLDKPEAARGWSGALEAGVARWSQEVVKGERTGLLQIEGEAGSGKTVLLEHVAYVLAQHHTNCPLPVDCALEPSALEEGGPLVAVPLVLKASELAKRLSSSEAGYCGLAELVEALRGEVHSAAPTQQVTAQELEAGLRAGRYLVLMDSLDEVSTSAARANVLRCLEGASKQEGLKLRVVLTSRPQVYTGVGFGEEWSQLRIAPLDSSTSDALMARWCEAMGKDPGFFARMQTSLRHTSANQQQANFLLNPLLLTCAMFVYLSRLERLPRDAAELYAEMISILCKAKAGVGATKGGYAQAEQAVALDPNDCHQLLKRVAEMIQRQGTQERSKEGSNTWLGLDAVVRGLERWRPDDFGTEEKRRELVRRLGEQTGLLLFEQADSRSPVRMRFWHRSFQEFLCAQQLDSSSKALNEIVDGFFVAQGRSAPLLDQDAWWGVLRFLAGVWGTRSTELAPQYVQRLRAHALGLDGCARHARPGRVFALLTTALDEYDRYFQGDPLLSEAPKEILDNLDSAQPWPIRDRVAALEALGRLGDPRLALERLWVEVPAGSFVMGQDQAAIQAAPRVRFRVGAFKMAWRPVVVQDYRAFVDDGGYGQPQWWEGLKLPEDAKPEGWEQQLRTPNRPVVGVSWFEAVAFCRWATQAWQRDGFIGKGEMVALPQEAQWEYVAAGPQGRIYPWGNQEPADEEGAQANYGARLGEPSPVGAFPLGKQGRFVDLGGNVWEWCWDVYAEPNDARAWEGGKFCQEGDKVTRPRRPDNAAARVLRGGSWNGVARRLRCAFRYRDGPGARLSGLGFRVVCVPAAL